MFDLKTWFKCGRRNIMKHYFLYKYKTKQSKVKNKCVLKWNLNSEFLDHSGSILSLCCRFAWKKIEVISTSRSCQENMMSVVKYNVDCSLWLSTKGIEHESTIFRFCNCLESFIKIGT